MEKAVLVKSISERLKLQPQVAEQAINEVVATLVSSTVFKRPGEQVAFLDNSCTNNCKEPLTTKTSGAK